MAAQNIGAGRWDRVGAITRVGLISNIVLITRRVIAALILFDRPVLALFLGSDSPALPIARHIQLIATWNFLLFGVTMVLFATVRANGAACAPLIILAIALYPVRLGFALLAQAVARRGRAVVELPARVARDAGDRGVAIIATGTGGRARWWCPTTARNRRTAWRAGRAVAADGVRLDLRPR